MHSNPSHLRFRHISNTVIQTHVFHSKSITMPQACYPESIPLDGSRKYDLFIQITSDFVFGINMVNFSF
jgi:hypothetical protein